MRVPATQVDLHHPHSGFDEPPRHEKRLTPLFAPVEVANAIGFAGQIERIVPTRPTRYEQLQRLMAIGVPRIKPARSSGRIESLATAIDTCEQGAPVLNLRDRTSPAGQIGQAKIGSPATRVAGLPIFACPIWPAGEVRSRRLRTGAPCSHVSMAVARDSIRPLERAGLIRGTPIAIRRCNCS